MATDMCTRRLTRELRALQKEPIKSPTIIAVPDEANILEWHYVIEGNKGTPYEGGYYHGKLIFPKQYPLKPPSVIMLTPSGRFTTNRRLCLSMSDFHPESWNPMWSISTILTGLYSFMIEKSPTLGSIETSTNTKKRLAKESLEYNVTNSKIFCTLFPDYVDLYNKIKKEQEEANNDSSNNNNDNTKITPAIGGAGGNNNPEDVIQQGLYTAAAAVVAIISLLFAMRFL